MAWLHSFLPLLNSVVFVFCCLLNHVELLGDHAVAIKLKKGSSAVFLIASFFFCLLAKRHSQKKKKTRREKTQETKADTK